MTIAEQKTTENAVEARSTENLEPKNEVRSVTHTTKDKEAKEAKEAPVLLNGSPSPLAHKIEQVNGEAAEGGPKEKVEIGGDAIDETTDGDDEDANIVYPSGIALALLTFV